MCNKLTLSVGALLLIGCLIISSDVLAQQPPPPGGGPNFSHAIEVLGTTTAELTAAIGGPPPDFEGAAKKYGLSLKEFLALLPVPPQEHIPEGFTVDDFWQP